MRLLIAGPPGAGKGTQSTRISALLGVPHISSGEVLRDAMGTDSRVGESVRAWIDRGQLVPDELVLSLLQQRFSAPDAVEQGYVLDGFPRNRRQARLLRYLDPYRSVDAVIRLVVPTSVVRERLRRRGRDDDHASAVRVRLAEYEDATRPMLDEFARTFPVAIVDAARPIDEVTSRVLSGLRSHGLIDGSMGAEQGSYAGAVPGNG